MGSQGRSILSSIVLRVVIGSIRQVFVGFGYHAELGFLSVVLFVSSSFSPPTLVIVEDVQLGRTWFMYPGYYLPVQCQVD